MVFPIVGGNQSTGDFVTNSLRLNDDDSPSLSLDLSSPNTDKFTLSMWVKMTGARTQLTALGKRLTGEAGDNRSIDIEQNANGRLGISAYNGVADSNVAAYNSNTGAGPLLRDTSAWYHFVYAFDTGQGTAGNRLKWYVNGVLQSGYNTTTTPSQNADLFDSSGSMIRIGRALNTESNYGDMYLAQYYYVDGQQYDHTYFGEFNDNGVWIPVENGKGAGGAITFGTNGFYLEFKETGTSANASGIGADTSGNDKHLTPANLTAIDVVTDTPQNNFCTVNPLGGTNSSGKWTFSEGNTQIQQNNNGSWRATGSTMAVANGKWYWEIEFDAGTMTEIFVGVHDSEVSLEGTNRWVTGSTLFYNHNGGEIRQDGTDTTNDYGVLTAGDILGIALNMDDNQITFYDNGSAIASNFSLSSSITGFAMPTFLSDSSDIVYKVNFGNAPFSISSGNSDGAGFGNFEYAVPSGYYSLCTKNLAEFG